MAVCCLLAVLLIGCEEARCNVIGSSQHYHICLLKTDIQNPIQYFFTIGTHGLNNYVEIQS